LIGALVLAGCGGSGESSGDESSGGGLTIAIGSEPTTLDPQLRDDGGERAVNDNIYETLMARTAEGALIPWLATEAPTQVDEKTWQFVLKQDVKFHNGEPFNAASVVHSVERMIDPAFKSEQATSHFTTIEGAEAVDEYTVKISTKVPDPQLPGRFYIMKMVPVDASQEADFADNPVGTGPYRFVEWIKGDHARIEQNKDYWGDANNVETVDFRFISEPATRLSALLAGEIDLMTNLFPEDVDRAPKSAAVEGLESQLLILNTVEGPTKDVRVRQAMNFAIDREALAKNLFGGYANLSKCQVLGDNITGHNPDLEPWQYDPDKARELIAAAGAKGAKIEIVGTAGRWLKDRETTEAVATYLQEVGFDAQPKIFEFTEYINRLFGEVRPDAVYLTSGNELFDADRPMAGYYELGGTATSNDDKELTEWIRAARTETDPDARNELYARITKKTCDESYFIYILTIQDIYGMSEKLEWQPRVDAKLLVTEMSIGADG
jgi:peptide/nickel transport system substrate-binding protein